MLYSDAKRWRYWGDEHEGDRQGKKYTRAREPYNFDKVIGIKMDSTDVSLFVEEVLPFIRGSRLKEFHQPGFIIRETNLKGGMAHMIFRMDTRSSRHEFLGCFHAAPIMAENMKRSIPSEF